MFAPTDIARVEMVRAIGARWTIEAVLRLAKRQVSLDQYEVRSSTGWHGHTILALLAIAALVLGAAKRGAHRPTTTSSPSAFPSCGAS